MSNSHNVLQQAWRTGFSKPGGLTIPCQSPEEAASLRFALYNAVKKFRNGKVTPDTELSEAMDQCSISFTPDKCGVVLQRKVEAGMMPSLMALMGNPVLETVDQKLSREMAARMEAQLVGLATGRGGENQAVPGQEPLAGSARYGLRHPVGGQ